MKKSILLLLLSAFVFAGFSQKPKDSKGFLPKEMKKLYFGMSWEEFQKVKKLGMVEVSTIMEFRIEYSEEPEKGNIKKITWYFDAEGDFPMYEVIIDYHEADARDQVADKLLGPPNDGEDWYFERPESFNIKAWKFNNKLVIVAVLEGTEWE